MFKRMFRRHKPKTALELVQRPFLCSVCGEEHWGPFGLSSDAPLTWGGPIEPEPNSAARMEGDFLSADLCVIGGEDFFVRGIVDIPVEGLSENFGFCCWSSLSRANFELYVAHFDSAGLEALGPWTGWFANDAGPYPDSFNEPCSVYPREAGTRPLIVLEDPDHPLARAQRDGITAEELLAIYRANSHGPDA